MMPGQRGPRPAPGFALRTASERIAADVITDDFPDACRVPHSTCVSDVISPRVSKRTRKPPAPTGQPASVGLGTLLNGVVTASKEMTERFTLWLEKRL